MARWRRSEEGWRVGRVALGATTEAEDGRVRALLVAAQHGRAHPDLVPVAPPVHVWRRGEVRDSESAVLTEER